MPRRNAQKYESTIAPDVVARVREALGRSEIMVLSSSDTEAGTWTCPLQYQSDQRLHLFFTSRPESRHVDNLARDERVSVAIYSFPGPAGGNLGLQLTGTARRLNEEASSGEWLRFEVVPSGIWYFDSRVDGYRHRVELSLLQAALEEPGSSPGRD
jgi:general stress protein 26